MKKIFQNKKILVTGGTGSVGREIVKALIPFNPRTIRIFDFDENSQHELQEELKEHKNILRFLLGDIRDANRLRLAAENIDIIFHTAGLKHVLACEYNPFEAVKTNILGTQNIIDVAMSGGVEKVIFTSSDKAVNPTSTMGASKLLAEKLMIAANYYRGPKKTAFSCIRFGNILGSRGSIVPLFKKQIKNDGCITITDYEMTRFIISLKEALNLIFKATILSAGGEIFILKMPAVRITELAEALIEELAPIYRRDPKEIKIKKIGPRAGEKLYEELMTEEEAKRVLELEDLLVIPPKEKELVSFNDSKYRKANPSTIKKYRSSKDAKSLSKEEIRKIIITGGLP